MKTILQKVFLVVACVLMLPACATNKQRMTVSFTNASNQAVYLVKNDFGPDPDEKEQEKALRKFRADRVAAGLSPDVSPAFSTPLVQPGEAAAHRKAEREAARRAQRGLPPEGAAVGGVIGGVAGCYSITKDGKRIDHPVITLPPRVVRPDKYYDVKPGETIAYDVGEYWQDETTRGWTGPRYGGISLKLEKEGREVPNTLPPGWFHWYDRQLPPPVAKGKIHLGAAVWDGKTVQFKTRN